MPDSITRENEASRKRAQKAGRLTYQHTVTDSWSACVKCGRPIRNSPDPEDRFRRCGCDDVRWSCGMDGWRREDGNATGRSDVCDFDGGPLHEATIRVSHEDADGLPVVLVTDAGDWWSTYVLLDRRDDERFRRYSYDGEAKPGEIDRCPRVPKGNRVDTEEATTS